MSHRFKHAPTITHVRGNVRVTCVCGWPGARCESEQEAHDAYTAHVGHRERKPQTVRLELEPDEEAAGVEILLAFSSLPSAAVYVH